MQYSPKLKKAMCEIQEILKKNDIAAAVVLHTPGHSEYLLEISPTYACTKVDGDIVRIRAKLKEFNGDKKAMDTIIANTSNMLNVLANTMGQTSLSLFDISEQLDNLVDAEHTGGDGTSHTTQNN